MKTLKSIFTLLVVTTAIAASATDLRTWRREVGRPEDYPQACWDNRDSIEKWGVYTFIADRNKITSDDIVRLVETVSPLGGDLGPLKADYPSFQGNKVYFFEVGVWAPEDLENEQKFKEMVRSSDRALENLLKKFPWLQIECASRPTTHPSVTGSSQ